MVLSHTESPTVHRLPATPSTVHWGYFDPRLEPVLTVASGDLVAIETLTHHAGDAPDLLMDAGIADVFDRVHDRGLDFSVTQVVDQRQGIHGRIDKRCFPRWVGVPA